MVSAPRSTPMSSASNSGASDAQFSNMADNQGNSAAVNQISNTANTLNSSAAGTLNSNAAVNQISNVADALISSAAGGSNAGPQKNPYLLRTMYPWPPLPQATHGSQWGWHLRGSQKLPGDHHFANHPLPQCQPSRTLTMKLLQSLMKIKEMSF